jgi:hypothetical protein
MGQAPFLSVLADLPGSPKGIMVTAKGYQKGVLQLAQAKGIELCLLRTATSEDFDGEIPALDAVIYSYFSSVQKAASYFEEPVADRDALNAYMKRNANEIPLFDAGGVPVGIFSELYRPATRELMNEMMTATVDHMQRVITMSVERNVYVRIAPEAKLEKVTKLTFEIIVQRVAPKVTLSNAITHIFQSATGDKTYTVDKNFRIVKPGGEISVEHIFDLSRFLDRPDSE